MAANSPIGWILAAGLFILLLIAVYNALRPQIIEEITEETYAPFEAFQDKASAPATAAEDFYFCPADTKYFIDKQGDSMCCDGEVKASRCMGTVECTFSAPKNGIRTCGEIRTSMHDTIQANMCPPSMPNYYENAAGHRGCTASALNNARTAPVNEALPQCVIHGDADKNAADETSCQNIRDLEAMACVAAGCKKATQAYVKGLPAVLTQTFIVETDDIPKPRMCIDPTSYARFMDAKLPGWRSDPKNDLSLNLSMCDVAKRVYVNKEVIPGVNDLCPAA